MSTLISSLLGCIFLNVAETDFTYFINIQSTFGALLMALLANVFSTALPSLIAFPEERPVFLREYSTNHYSVTAYFSSRLSMEFLVTAAQVTVSTLITYFVSLDSFCCTVCSARVGEVGLYRLIFVLNLSCPYYSVHSVLGLMGVMQFFGYAFIH